MRKTTRKQKQVQWLEIIGQFQKSGDKSSQFCKKHRIKPASLQYWLRKTMPDVGTQAAESSFVEVVASSPESIGKISHPATCEITLPSGIRITLSGQDSQTITSIIKALEGSPC